MSGSGNTSQVSIDHPHHAAIYVSLPYVPIIAALPYCLHTQLYLDLPYTLHYRFIISWCLAGLIGPPYPSFNITLPLFIPNLNPIYLYSPPLNDLMTIRLSNLNYPTALIRLPSLGIQRRLLGVRGGGAWEFLVAIIRKSQLGVF